ncbi:Golgi transport complex subunit COG4 [Aspergillus saccharolyticus JOP 1030-1]|uniref:Conserved oligomeric Golgi complex subunit 4 n=1 Tax=Aspergillus saccharolyticus JOP 1030-1 TaxID=1450539 RepID=A0A318ZLI8_9EURO|nr:COG4-domain-containing protein [Aspergillus saccharolyticus JOP 1030-1]PYH47747.1 COG4-domain-containing protein [Aspergillus saccharolyticus JOP 1030-1]
MVNSPLGTANGYSHAESSPSNTPTTVYNASSVAEIKATLSHLHEQEASVTARLDAFVASQKDFSRELGRLDLLRANLGSQTSTTRAISHGMLADAATTADRISSAVRRLDREQSRVKATLAVVDQVAELKACVLGVAGSMGAPQDWETAASYLHRAAKIPSEVVHGAFAAEMVPTAEVPDPPHVTLDNAAESLCGLFLREFDKAVQENNGARITRFFKLFPLIGRSEVGLDVYGRYVCQGVAARARTNLNAAGGQAKDGFFYASVLTKLFEHIAQIIDGHGGLVERHYGPRKMNRVIERLQLEADVQGGIILDTWSDERHVDRKLTDIKSYAFTFLVQSFLPPPRGGGTPRSNSPATRDGAAEDEGVDMKEIDGLLNEMAVMLGRWSLYCRFLADTCNPPGEKDSTDQFALPEFLRESALANKINDRLAAPFNAMTTFFFRRSVEKAFQLDEQPSGLTLNPHKPLKADPPHITSAVDDIMYIVNKVIQQSLATSQMNVVTTVVPTVSRVLGSDFIGMTQRKMRDECYPRAAVQGATPPESLTISFLVLINNLDVAVDYSRRILHKHTEKKGTSQSEPSSTTTTDPIQALFPSPTEAQLVTQTLHSLASSFESKVTDLLTDGIQVVFNNVIKHRLRPILSDAFRDIEYQPRDDTDPVRTTYNAPVPTSMNEYYDSDDPIIGSTGAATADGEADPGAAELVGPRFATAWNELLLPISRILTTSAFDRLLTITVAYLARLLEKRLWSYHGRVNALGATRLERDVSGVVSAAVDVGGSQGRYRHRDAFVRCLQMVLVMGMDEDEWDDVMRGGETAEVVEKLSREERMRVRAMVRRA